MPRQRATAVLVWSVMASCGASPSMMGAGGALEPKLLGAQPAPALPDGGAGPATFSVWLTGRRGDRYEAPEPGDVTVQCNGSPCEVLSTRSIGGEEQGALAVVVDDSGSNTAAPTVCTGCPTDPQGHRITAVKALFQTLYTIAPRWRSALFDFGPRGTPGFRSSRFIAGYTGRVQDLLDGAEQLKSTGGTYLYDALAEVSPTVAGEARAMADGGAALPAHVLIVSDGEDTNSWYTLAQGLDAGVQNGVVFDAVGYGGSDGGALPLLAGRAYRDLRTAGSATGGFVTLEDAAALPALFERLAHAYRAGYVEVVLRRPEGAVHGVVRLNGGTQQEEFDL